MKKIIFAVIILAFALHTTITAQIAPNNMVLIKSGTFTMGSPSNEPERNDNEIQHQVTVNGFYMGKYEVTQKEYQEIIGTNPSRFKRDNLPVENVSWYDAIEYCNKRSQKEGLTTAYTIYKNLNDTNNTNGTDNVEWTVALNENANGYRLPTDAEWEYACRAGTTTPFSTGNNITTDQANYNGNEPYNNNAKGKNRGKTTPVGNFAPNAWGLYDMHGNVWEWCWDSPVPTRAVSGTYHVVRGGSWNFSAGYIRSAFRAYTYSSLRGENLGFRLVRKSD
jgi:formylglycine-generating enzyme required for sulfatase activity